ncbi:hypothetical protein JAAARDRAFT_201749 [Jaapia argillacea MUCL 33604]|uniref:Pentacotripeptide-repeat region of PRORP domain-containing protein n=1 Tax=Jaapia argillacea MUCL 33604 TaxID=933084 RepID=A0A067QBR4_9AGAM|nr:hypothetical protein JAAARDRAFT_201749 [Jaapia argillacea MUCL 33604]
MLEPVGAIVFSSLLASRTTAGHCPSAQSALRVVLQSMNPSTVATSSNVRVRRAKGKGKAVGDGPSLSGFVPSRPLGEKCAMNHTLWCPDKRRVFMAPEIIPRRSLLMHNFKPPPPHIHCNTRSHSSLSLQRRRNSTLSPDSADDPPIATHYDLVQAVNTFSSFLHLSPDDFALEAAWSAYTRLRDHRALESITIGDFRSFIEKLVTSAETALNGDMGLRELRDWGLRIQELLQYQGAHVDGLREDDFWCRSMSCRTLTLLGDIESASSRCRQLDASTGYEEKHLVFPVFNALFLAIGRHKSVVAAFDFLLHEWASVGGYLLMRSARWRASQGKISTSAASLRQSVHSTLLLIQQPASLLVDQRLVWDPARRSLVGELLIDALCLEGLPEDAIDVLEEMQKQHIAPSLQSQLTLVRALVKANAFDLANTLFSSIAGTNPTFKYFFSTGLYLFAHQGDVVRAEEYYEQLQRRGRLTAPDFDMLMHASAVNGDAQRVVQLFHQLFAESSPDKRPAVRPTIIHYTTLVLAHAQCCDFEGMNAWLEAMTKDGIAPDVHVYTVILHSFAMRGEVDSIVAVLDQMRAAGIPPNVVSYNTVISLLANRKDPVAAEAIYRRAVKEGITPDRRMLASLMNAHVEAGSWQGVIRAFDYLKASPSRHLRLSVDVYTTLLKAYVLIGAPFHVVSQIFRKLQEARVRPQAHTFALLIQSACDSGHMDTASELFEEMDKLSEHWQSYLHINTYVLTILMSGYLRVGNKVRAKEIYDDMRSRGIQPTSVTFGAILKAYGNEKTDESLQLAEDFLKTLIDVDASQRPWVRPTRGRMSALEHVYSPLMTVYTKKTEPQEVERLFQGMLDAGGEPTLGTLTILLDAYRRVGNVEATLQVWPQIFQLALRYSQVGALFEDEESGSSRPEVQRQANLLCIPLSIYVDALSSAGLHLQIADVWRKLQMLGFTFDSHNWNHLAIALVRAGEVERAFEIIERVILPYQQQSGRIMMSRNVHPDSPLSFDSDSPTEDQSPLPVATGHSGGRRAAAVLRATVKSGALLDIEDDQEHQNDFAHPLHVLHQISPAWNIWHPHAVTLRVLSQVLSHLESGRVVQPIELHQSDDSQTQEDAAARAARVRLAADILSRIYSDYPTAVSVIHDFERRDRRRNTVQASPT